MVLKGEIETSPASLPIVIPELQNRSVISVVLGDYHFGALTSSGKLLTWGQYCKGALGLGDPGKLPPGSSGGFADEERRARAAANLGRGAPLDAATPSEVRFDHGLKAEGRVERYCFAAAASGWHTGALVIDLAGDEVPPEDLIQHFEPAVQWTGNARSIGRGRGWIHRPILGVHMPPPAGTFPDGDV